MTLFEYLVIAYSMVLSFAALRLVAGLPHAIDASRRYPVHVCYVAIMIFTTAAAFWAQWSLRDVEWNFPRFLIQFVGPGIIYYLACTLIPDEPSSVGSWQDYFFFVRRRFFAGLCLWALVLAVNSTLLMHTSMFHPFRLVQLGILILGIAGLATDRPSAHRSILILTALVATLATFILLRPGTLTS